MLGDHDSSAIVAVRDLEHARHFYGETLGLEAIETSDAVVTYRTGATRLTVYRSDAAGGTSTNAVVWNCGAQIEAITAALKARGVTFEQYPELGMALQGDLHVEGDFRAAWFRDPEGNILHLNSM